MSALSEISLAFLLLLLLAIFQTSSQAPTPQPPIPTLTPAPSPQKPLSAQAREYLDAHNQARSAVGVPPLNWSDSLAGATSRQARRQRDQMGCQFADLSSSKYGANQLWAGGALYLTPRMVVDHWVQEKNFYDHANNSCAANHRCGVYTQVVWRKTVELGCAQVACAREGASLTICFYNPPGNVVGESPY